MRMNKILSVIIFLNLIMIPAYATTLPSLQVTTNTTPSIVAPGDNGYIEISITNIGTVAADEVFITLKSLESPLIAKTKFSESGVGGLDIGKSVSTVFAFSVPEATEKGFYKAEFKIQGCENFVCKETSQYSVIEVKNPATNFELSFQETTKGITSIYISNVGINSAIAVSIEVPQQDEFSTLGTSKVFLGNLNPGDFTTADFKLVSKKNLTEDNLNLIISYTDTSGNRFSDQEQVLVKLESQEENSNQNSTSSEMLYIGTIVALVIIVIVLFFWKRKKK